MKTNEPNAVETGNTKVRENSGQRTADLERNNSVTGLKTSIEERTEEKPSSSQTRPKEGVTSLSF